MRASLLALILIFSLTACSRAGDAPGGFDAVFDASARKPVLGEWLEYRVAIPVDPMENSLSPSPIPPSEPAGIPPPRVVELDGEAYVFRPTFEAVPAWRVLPLRLEILHPLDDGYRARMTFEGKTREVVLPGIASGSEMDFRYDAPQPPDGTAVLRLDGDTYEVTVCRRVGEAGFVRHSHPDLPFGLARFATEHVDIVLVGMGTGTPPAFPLHLDAEPFPTLGELYGAARE